MKQDKKKLELDHMFSCYGGWVNKISPRVISSIYNLQWLPERENVQKGQYCSITLEQLLNDYSENKLNEIRHTSVLWENINEIIDESN